jgi:hypothetical protein
MHINILSLEYLKAQCGPAVDGYGEDTQRVPQQTAQSLTEITAFGSGTGEIHTLGLMRAARYLCATAERARTPKFL